MYQFFFKTSSWERIYPINADVGPCPRVGHSAVIKYDKQKGDCMYIFGGKDDENNKLNDTWKFNFTTKEWAYVECVDDPAPRSGHAACIFKDYMIVYGGIYDICKELNDMHIFDMKNDRWLCLFEELYSPQGPAN